MTQTRNVRQEHELLVIVHQATGSHTAAQIQSSAPFRWNDLFHLNWPKTEEGLWDS